MTTTFDVMVRLKEVFKDVLSNHLAIVNKHNTNEDARLDLVEPIKDMMSTILVQNSWHNLGDETNKRQYLVSLGVMQGGTNFNDVAAQFFLDITTSTLSHFDSKELGLVKQAMQESASEVTYGPTELDIKGWMVICFLIKLCAADVIKALHAIK